MLNNKKVKLIFLFVVFSFFLSTGFVFALEINYPNVPGATPPQEFLPTAPPEQILPLYVKYIFNLIIWTGGIIAFGVLIYAGIRYLISAGKPEVIISAKNQISSAFLGILLLLSSSLILKLLNPQLVVLEIPEPEPVEGVERQEASPPPAEFHLSSINTEIPFAKIIEEKIFEAARMTRIKEKTAPTPEIAGELVEINNQLSQETEECACYDNTVPNPRCRSCGNCPPKECTCDPCKPVRSNIEKLEQKNLEKLDELKEEQKKTIEEIRPLKEELGKLERAEKLMLECKLAPLASLAEFLGTKKFYITNKWLILDIKFWDTILTIEDWANFYCPVSGTIWGGEQPPAESTTTATTTGLSYAEVPQGAEETMACSTEIPVGEIIDRAKRIGSKLVERLEALVAADNELISAVDEMQVLVSQCSSKNCFPVCYCYKGKCIEVGCFGSPCPSAEISEQAKKIEQIQKDIEKLVKEEKKEEMGIIPIIDKVVPKLLEDVDKLIRKPMKQCISEISPEMLEGQPQVILSDCESALRAIGPKGKIIENCCYEQPEFKECLNNCYLEKGQEKYKKCLEECLKKKSDDLKGAGKTRGGEIIATCRHKINFYCCGK